MTCGLRKLVLRGLFINTELQPPLLLRVQFYSRKQTSSRGCHWGRETGGGGVGGKEGPVERAEQPVGRGVACAPGTAQQRRGR